MPAHPFLPTWTPLICLPTTCTSMAAPTFVFSPLFLACSFFHSSTWLTHLALSWTYSPFYYRSPSCQTTVWCVCVLSFPPPDLWSSSINRCMHTNFILFFHLVYCLFLAHTSPSRMQVVTLTQLFMYPQHPSQRLLWGEEPLHCPVNEERIWFNVTWDPRLKTFHCLCFLLSFKIVSF